MKRRYMTFDLDIRNMREILVFWKLVFCERETVTVTLFFLFVCLGWIWAYSIGIYKVVAFNINIDIGRKRRKYCELEAGKNYMSK